MYNENCGLSLLKTTTTAKFYIQTCHQAVWFLPDIPSPVLLVKLCLRGTTTSHCYQTLSECLSRPFTGWVTSTGWQQILQWWCFHLLVPSCFFPHRSLCMWLFYLCLYYWKGTHRSRQPSASETAMCKHYELLMRCLGNADIYIYTLYFYWGEQWEPQIEEEKVVTNLDVFIWLI